MRFKTLFAATKRVSPEEMPELMDGDCTYEEFRDCLRSLERVNRWLLGYRPTLSWLASLPRESLRRAHVVDVGSGGGDLLRRIDVWARHQGLTLQLTGIDLNPYAERAAREFTPRDTKITWVTGDALVYRPEKPIDIVVSSLTAHHLEDRKIVALVRWMEATAELGWFINDLKRSERTAALFSGLSRVAQWHRFVQHDGPVSFRRSFQQDDWQELLAAAGLPREDVTVEHWNPGRLCVGRIRLGSKTVRAGDA